MYILPCEIWDIIYDILLLDRQHLTYRSLRATFRYMWSEHPLDTPLTKEFVIDTDMQHILMANPHLHFNRKDILHAISRQSMRTLIYFDSLNLLNKKNLLDYAAINNCKEALDYLERKRWSVDPQTVNIVAGNGHIDMLQHLANVYNIHPNQSGYSRAVGNGHVDVVKYMGLPGVGPYTVNNKDVNRAAKNGHYNMVLLLEKYGYYCDGKIINQVVINGHLSIVEHLETRGFRCNRSAVNIVASKGYLNLLKHMISMGYYCDPYVVDKAAVNGHLETVKFLEELGMVCSDNGYQTTISNGNLEMVQYLEDHYNFTPQQISLDKAVGNGHLELLKYVHNKYHMMCSQSGLDLAVGGGHVEVVKYINQHSDLNIELIGIMLASMYDRTDMIRYLMSTGEMRRSIFDSLNDSQND